MSAPVRSLRLRLLLGAGLAIMLALTLAGAGMVGLFVAHIEQREATSLERKAKELIAGLTITSAGTPRVDPLPSDHRFSQPASGLYWQVSTARGAVQSPSLWDQSLPMPASADMSGWARRHDAGPFDRGQFIIARLIRPDRSGRAVLVQMATDDDALITARTEFAYEIAASLALLWLVLMGAAYLQVTLGLRPLARVASELEGLRKDSGARLSNDHPGEILPLASAINALVDARAFELDRARRRAADLAHSLKTPLAALVAQSRKARTEGAEAAADGLDRAIASIGAALEFELARAKSALARNHETVSANVGEAVENVIGVTERTEDGERLVFDIRIDPQLQAPLASGDLLEILGALIENAARHARRQIRIEGYREGEKAIITIGDDGAGIAEDRLELALTRGARLDESGQGYGFGLHIVRELVAITGGHLAMQRSTLGGLETMLSWRDDETRGALT